MSPEPIAVPKSDYGDLIRRISVADSPVGIDAQDTHAIIVTYLQRIEARLERMESRWNAERG